MSTEFVAGQGNGSDESKSETVLAGAPQGAVVETFVEELDADDIALNELRKAAEAAEPGSRQLPKSDDQTDTGAGTTPPKDGQQQDQGQPEGGKGPRSVPVERFNEVYRTAKEREAEIARLAGENAALRSQRPPPPPAVNPQKAELDDQIVALAQKFDAGEITAVEWKRQERQLTDQLDQIRTAEAVAAARQAQPQTPQQSQSDLYFNTQSRALEAAYNKFTDLIPEQYFGGFIEGVRAELAAEGITEIRQNSEELLLFRQRVGEKAQAEAAKWAALSGKQVPAAAGQPGRQGQVQQVTPEQRLAKLQMAAGMPPDISAMRRSDGTDTVPGDEALEGMDEEAIGALPEAMRNKILGIQT